jgi:hypothetical protein
MEGKPTIPEVVPLIRDYYRKPENGVGGHLHIVLEDSNIQDAHLRFCRDAAREAGDHDGQVLAEILLRMSKTQRAKLASMSFSSAYLDPPV